MKKQNVMTTAAMMMTVVAATPAAASSDNYIELQMPTTTVATLIHERLLANANFCPVNLPCPWSSNETCILDHFEVGAPGSIYQEATSTFVVVNPTTSLPGRRVLVDQMVDVVLQTEACSEDPDCDTRTVFPVQATFEVYASGGNLCARSVSYTPQFPGVTPPPLDTCFSLNLDAINGLAGGDENEISGAGLSMDAGGTRLGVRMELNRADNYDASRIAAWVSFLNGNLTGTETTPWSVFVHKSLPLNMIRSQVEGAIASESSIELDGSVNTTWTPLGASGVQIGTALTVDFLDSPCPGDIPIDIGLVANASLNPASNGILTTGSYEFDPDAGSCSVLGPAGLAVLASLETGILDSLLESYELDISKFSGDCTSSDQSFSCDEQTHPIAMSIAFGKYATAHLSAVVGTQSGLTLSGPLDLPTNSLPPILTVESLPPVYGLSGTCASAGCEYYGGIYLTGTAQLCDVSVSNDVHGIFNWTIPEMALPMHIELGIDPMASAGQLAAYENNPQPLHMTVRSTLGVKTYEIGISTLLSQAEQWGVCMQELTKHMVLCTKEVNANDWMLPPERWNPDWRINNRIDALVQIFDRRGQVIDGGYANGIRLDVATDFFGRITSAEIVFDAHSRLGQTGRVESWPTSVALSVPTGTRYTNDRDLLRAALNPKNSNTRLHNSIAPALLPQGITSASVELVATPAELEAILVSGGSGR